MDTFLACFGHKRDCSFVAKAEVLVGFRPWDFSEGSCSDDD